MTTNPVEIDIEELIERYTTNLPEAHRVLIKRYNDVLDSAADDGFGDDKYLSNAHLKQMLDTIVINQMESGKANRWIGFVQGVMACKGLLDVDAEREFTRRLLV